MECKSMPRGYIRNRGLAITQVDQNAKEEQPRIKTN